MAPQLIPLPLIGLPLLTPLLSPEPAPVLVHAAHPDEALGGHLRLTLGVLQVPGLGGRERAGRVTGAERAGGVRSQVSDPRID